MAKKQKQPTPDEAPNFDDDINTAIHVVTIFRDLLSDETARIDKARRDKPAEFDPAKHAHLHRLRVAADSFISALNGAY
jgi:hypothetical protein